MNLDIVFNILSFFHIRNVSKYFIISSIFNECDNNLLWNILSHRDLSITIDKETFKLYRKINDEHINKVVSIFNNNPQCIAIDIEILINKRIVTTFDEKIIYDGLFDTNNIYNRMMFNILFNPYKNNKKIFKKELKRDLFFIKRNGNIVKIKNNDINFYISIFIHILHHDVEYVKQLGLKKHYDNYFKNFNRMKDKIMKSLS